MSMVRKRFMYCNATKTCSIKMLFTTARDVMRIIKMTMTTMLVPAYPFPPTGQTLRLIISPLSEHSEIASTNKPYSA